MVAAMWFLFVLELSPCGGEFEYLRRSPRIIGDEN
jgi:hypothetical protein